MKRARVSSVYEGKERNKSRKGEETRRDKSKHARMNAKVRMSVHKESMKSRAKHKKPMMIMKPARKNEETRNDQKNVVGKEKEEKDKGVVENAEMVLSGWVEEWPQMLTYEDEWTWFAFAFGWEWWRRYDAVMSGESWFH
ncbi:hypothetical protein V5N11_025670 [Cardamine amara subsp. amara]|uniref:Uncharacterized protein n=1 Tax=Cardamine amara subsp. amara TaxID=228776 RepID=A0ABD1C1I6_CARAN